MRGVHRWGWRLAPGPNAHLLASALHDLQRDGEDLVVHSHRPPSDLHQEDSEVSSPQIQGKELSFLCGRESGGCIPPTHAEQGPLGTWRKNRGSSPEERSLCSGLLDLRSIRSQRVS